MAEKWLSYLEAKSEAWEHIMLFKGELDYAFPYFLDHYVYKRERTILLCLVSYIKMLIATTGEYTDRLIWFFMEFCYYAITYYGAVPQALTSALCKTADDQLEFAQQHRFQNNTVFACAFKQI